MLAPASILFLALCTSTLAVSGELHANQHMHKHPHARRDSVQAIERALDFADRYPHAHSTAYSYQPTSSLSSSNPSTVCSCSSATSSAPSSSSTESTSSSFPSSSSSSSSSSPISSSASSTPFSSSTTSSTSITSSALSTSSLSSTTSSSVSSITPTVLTTLITSTSSLPSTSSSSSTTTARTSTTVTAPTYPSSLPFSRVVAFGDNLSDNGNGSYAHGVAQPGDPTNSIYGYRTWTNGPVAVSFLVDHLGVPLTTNYAFGHANGGSLFGATIDNTYTQSTANAPSSKDQIANYSATGDHSQIGQTLHFLWIGANDINLYHVGTSDGNNNTGFANEMATMMTKQVQSLLDLGAGYVIVPNLYAKHISPSSEFYAGTPDQVNNLGVAIALANTAIKEAFSTAFGTTGKVIYYDAYGFMVNLWNNAAAAGITMCGKHFCDGYSQADWDLCVTQGHGDEFYWMQYLDMTSHVHKLLAADMASAVKSHFGL